MIQYTKGDSGILAGVRRGESEKRTPNPSPSAQPLPSPPPRLPFRMPFGVNLARHFVLDALRVRLTSRPRLVPLVLADFVTFRCNLGCAYCGYLRQGYPGRYPEVGTSDALRILEIGRQAAPSLAVSGGEPLLREDVVPILRHARALGFRPISLFTNSLLLPRREEVLDHVDFLQVSLDTPDEVTQDRLCGRTGVGREVKSLVRHYAAEQAGRGFRINLNCVLGPANLEGVPELLDFAAETGVRLSVCPELDEQGQPVSALREPETQQRYRRLLGGLLADKARRNTLLDTPAFLVHLRDFRAMQCYPDLAPRVYPDGSVPYPCPALARTSPNLLAAGSWKALRARIEADGGEPLACPRSCLLPCYLETSLLVQHPFALLREWAP